VQKIVIFAAQHIAILHCDIHTLSLILKEMLISWTLPYFVVIWAVIYLAVYCSFIDRCTTSREQTIYSVQCMRDYV